PPVQLWPPPALARRAFARPVAGALHSALGSTTGLKPAAPSYFTSDCLAVLVRPSPALGLAPSGTLSRSAGEGYGVLPPAGGRARRIASRISGGCCSSASQ